MKRRGIILTAGIFSLAGLAIMVMFFPFQVRAGSADPGSAADPLVTRSYVEDILSKKLALTVVELETGQILEGKAGAELVLRGGKAVAVIPPTAQGGWSDLTGGKDLGNGTPVPLNHLLVAARSDGRGIKAQSKVWVMVRGEYVIR